MEVRRRRKSAGPPVTALVIVGAAILGVVAGWWFLYRGDGGSDTMPELTATVAEDTVDMAEEAAVPPLELPELDASDPFIRNVVAGLSSQPRLASWLVNDDLIHRFVGAVVDLAGGASPVENLEFLQPEGEFAVRESGSAVLIDESSFRRYDGLVETFSSLDTEGTARLYRQLQPLFEEAFAELGIPDWTFEDTLGRAMENVLAVPVPTGPLRVEPDRTVYVFRDPQLEALSPAAKHLLRMGPENLRRIQGKVEALKGRIEALPPA